MKKLLCLIGCLLFAMSLCSSVLAAGIPEDDPRDPGAFADSSTGAVPGNEFDAAVINRRGDRIGGNTAEIDLDVDDWTAPTPDDVIMLKPVLDPSSVFVAPRAQLDGEFASGYNPQEHSVVLFDARTLPLVSLTSFAPPGIAGFARPKPHVNIGTIGHIDHGKTTLTAAIAMAGQANVPGAKSFNDQAEDGMPNDFEDVPVSFTKMSSQVNVGTIALSDIILIRTDSETGQVEKYRLANPPGGRIDEVICMRADESGNVYVTGYRASTRDIGGQSSGGMRQRIGLTQALVTYCYRLPLANFSHKIRKPLENL